MLPAMDESGTLPSDPSAMFDTPDREASPGPDASLPAGAPAAPAAAPGAAEAAAATLRRDRAATERKRRAWEAHRRQSMTARETIEGKLREAGGLSEGTQGAGGFRKADALLNEVRSMLGSELPGSPGQILIGPDRRACWDHWRQMRGTLKRVRDLRQAQDYQALVVPVAAVIEDARSGEPAVVMQRVKELQGQIGRAHV
jgi:hypothetical protein